MTKKDIVRLIAKLKHSELSKSLCGQRLIDWYNKQKEVLDS